MKLEIGNLMVSENGIFLVLVAIIVTVTTYIFKLRKKVNTTHDYTPELANDIFRLLLEIYQDLKKLDVNDDNIIDESDIPANANKYCNMIFGVLDTWNTEEDYMVAEVLMNLGRETFVKIFSPVIESIMRGELATRKEEYEQASYNNDNIDY